MRRILKFFINRLLKRSGIMAIERSQLDALTWERNVVSTLYIDRCTREKRSASNHAECIVFSKDRALQLHGLLRSFFEHVRPQVPIQVLYNCSGPDHQKTYDEVLEIFKPEGVRFVQQQSCGSFRSDLLEQLAAVQSDKIFFLVDDIIFTGRVDLDWLCSFDSDRYVPTLRMGLNLKRSYTMQQAQPLPPLREEPATGAGTICWQWQDGVLDWGYPLSVDGHLFSTDEIEAMIRLIEFCAPNSLEQGLQRFIKLFLPRMGIAYRISKIVNIPCNKVQLENDNIHGALHQDDLLAQWQLGMQIDVQRLQGFVSESAHQDIEIPLTRRDCLVNSAS
ncbi:MAG: hypothetical protein NTX06_04885 [Proteobacteria bacterium]|nr:hypothetical protein [Pseudomonadota bacterium]